MEIAFIILIFVGLLLMGLAAGFLLAISIGIRRRDHRGSYRSLREEGDESALSRSSRVFLGLRFRDQQRDLPARSRTPTAV